LEKAESEFKSKTKSSAFGKTVNYGNGISIDTDDVIYIENGTGFHSYTFNIQHENAPEDAPVQNLVLSPLADGTYRELLLSYNLNLQEKQMLANRIPIDTHGKVTITELAQGTYSNGGIMSKTNMSCEWVEETQWNSCSSGAHNGSNANQCEFVSNPQNGTPPTAYVIVAQRCTALPANTGLGDNGEGGGSGPPNGPGGLGGGDPEPEVPTIPNLPSGPNRNNDPCKQLKNLAEKQSFKDKVTILKNNINTGTVEKGFVLHDDATTQFSPIIDGNSEGEIDYNAYSNQISEDLLYKSYGSAHNHLLSDPDHVGVFTDKDLNNLLFYGLLETYPQNPNVKFKPEKSIVFVNTNIGFFALKITDLEKLRLFCIDFASWNVGKLEDFFKTTYANEKKYNIRHNSTHDQQVAGFLRFIKDYNIGIEFYEGNKDTFGNWKKLTLKDNNNGTFGFTETPCPL
jgi:hypothetical protein